ncbi:MAG: AAA family ATPase, partial [Chlorobiales bacterium]|nr:AAA family ATPase [Chlorobiales bacterium]
MSSQKFIITGGPGSGKSTLLEALKAQGFCCFEEASRELIKEQMALKSGILPWDNLPAFAELVFHRMIEQYEASTKQEGICFFDRGIPDIFGYLQNSGCMIPESYLTKFHACDFSQTVFILPPWPEIYTQDSERPQTYEDSVSLYKSIKSAYTERGFTLREVPKLKVEERLRYVMS